MKVNLRKTLVGAVMTLTLLVTAFGVNAAADHEREHDDDDAVAPVQKSETYSKECSSCHFLFTPNLLPSRSWVKLMKESDKHFGEDLALDENVKSELSAYLSVNSADNSRAEWSRKIASNPGKDTPIRITEMPYIIREHRKIKKEVFERPSIGSRSNCGACHTKGAQGDYEEDNISIPKK